VQHGFGNFKDGSSVTEGQRKAFQELGQEAKRLFQESLAKGAEHEERLTTITTVKRGVSIREFTRGKELGFGNFSEIVVCQHKVTGEKFALKIIEKKQAADLAKRQHPNVYNEIQMERRVLLERLPPHTNIVRMYHAFQDYNCIYYLMELYEHCGDLWSTIRYQGKMVGCHRSLAKIYLCELIDAIEHCHRYGIVHRDLKPENVLLNNQGHVVIIDFGTAKDLINTDLNGPEFVGTPDFMSPEAVSGTSSPKEIEEKRKELGADHTLDLYALGAIAYQLHSGMTPYWSPSQYLTFLKIKRGNLMRPWGIAEDETWDFIVSLMKVDPKQRLGADSFECILKPERKIVEKEGGYDVLRKHPYFTKPKKTAEDDSPLPCDARKVTPVPSLHDLCIRACATLASQDARDIDVVDSHPPGDGSSHDMMRLSARDRKCVMHFLDRLQQLSEPTVYRRFFDSNMDLKLGKVRQASCDYVGLTRMTDNQGQFPTLVPDQDPFAKPVEMEPIRIMHLSNPLLVREINEGCDGETRKQYIKLFKRCIAHINKSRPKLVVASGYVDESCRKLLARVNDSIPVVMADGSSFFSFWHSGVQGVVIRSSDWLSDDAENPDILDEQLRWIREEMEQCRMSKHQLFAFVDCDPRDLPETLSKRLARGATLCLFGPSKDGPYDTRFRYDGQDDNASVRSTDSEEDEHDSHTMRVIGTRESGLHCVTIEERESWKLAFSPLEL
jgi:serine/threonine protein kinase